MINISQTLKLIEASQLLNADQKVQMKAKLDHMSPTDLAEVHGALEREQAVMTEYYKNVAHIRKVAAEKKVKAYYDYAEASIEAREEQEIDQIEAELSNI